MFISSVLSSGRPASVIKLRWNIGEDDVGMGSLLNEALSLSADTQVVSVFSPNRV